MSQLIEVKGNTYRLASILFIAMCLMFIINGLIPQLQMSLYDGNIRYGSVLQKVALLGLVAVGFLFNLRHSIKVNRNLLIAWWSFACYILLDLILLKSNILSVSNLVTGMNNYYFFILVVPFLIYMEGAISERVIYTTIFILFVPLAVFGIMQFWTGDPMLPVISNDETFKIYSWHYYGEVRAFSLFDSGYSFGHFIALVGALVVTLKMNKFLRMSLLALVAVAAYSTLTRNSYLEITSVMVSAFFIKRYIEKTKLVGLIMTTLHMVAGLIVIWLVPYLGGKKDSQILLQDESFQMRVVNWGNAIDKWLGNDLFVNLFGTGIVQKDGVVIDNMFLAVGLHIGLIGFVLWIILMMGLTMYTFNEAKKRKSPFAIGIAAFWSSWCLVSLFNISINAYLMTFFLLAVSKVASRRIKVKKDKYQYSEKQMRILNEVIKRESAT